MKVEPGLVGLLLALSIITACAATGAADRVSKDPYDEAVRYFNGSGGFVLDRRKACDLFKISANLGNEFGILALADCHFLVAEYPRDPALALKLYEQAADYGSRRARSAFVAASLGTKYQKSQPAKVKARSMLKDLLRYRPDDDHMLFVRAVDLLASGHMKEGATELERASERGSSYAAALLGCLSRSCEESECGSVRSEAHYRARVTEIAAGLTGPQPNYSSLVEYLAQETPIGHLCAVPNGE